MDATLANITMFGGNFAPLSWHFCDGTLMSIAENTALFSLLGTTYGGDGQTTFALPDLRGRVPVGTGQGPGLQYVDLGQVWGTETITAITVNMPMHNHQISLSGTLKVNNDSGGEASPAGNYLGLAQTSTYAATSSGSPMATNLLNTTTGITGGSQPIGIMDPYLAINYIIAVEGIYPSRN